MGLVLALIGIATLSLAVARAASAEAPKGLIRVCYGGFDSRELHFLRARRCPDGETELDWNKAGRRGATGTTGKIGTTGSLSVAISLTGGTPPQHPAGDDTVWQWIEEALPVLAKTFAFAGLALLALGILLIPIGRIAGRLLASRHLQWFPPARWLAAPAVEILPFDDSGMTVKVGHSLASLAQARVGGGRENGMHLYLVTGEQPAGSALATLREVPEARTLAVALSLLKLTWGRRQLVVRGSLLPVGEAGVASLALALRRDSKFVHTADLWPSEPPTAHMTVADSNRALAVAAAGWIEHCVVDETPGPRAREVFYSSDARSWALFRAGAELQQISAPREAADAYEQALAIDPENVGALVDLAHLVRLSGHFPGAVELAQRAVDLIEARDKGRKLAAADDADWYRANIVLATVWSEWARRKEGANKHKEAAFELALTVARTAMDTRQRLETEAGVEELRRAAAGIRVKTRERWKARGRALARISEQLARPSTDREREAGLTRLARARRAGETCRADLVLDLFNLLHATFVPGALLLVASNAPALGIAPRPSRPSECHERKRRREARAELDDPVGLKPPRLIRYVTTLQVFGPRVEYNLACYYSRAIPEQPRAERQLECLDDAFEYLRRSISRSPPLERRALLDYAREDPDLRDLRRPRRRWRSERRRLERLVPARED